MAESSLPAIVSLEYSGLCTAFNSLKSLVINNLFILWPHLKSSQQISECACPLHPPPSHWSSNRNVKLVMQKPCHVFTDRSSGYQVVLQRTIVHIEKMPCNYVLGAGGVACSGRWLLALHLCTWSKFIFASEMGKGRRGQQERQTSLLIYVL